MTTVTVSGGCASGLKELTGRWVQPLLPRSRVPALRHPNRALGQEADAHRRDVGVTSRLFPDAAPGKPPRDYAATSIGHALGSRLQLERVQQVPPRPPRACSCPSVRELEARELDDLALRLLENGAALKPERRSALRTGAARTPEGPRVVEF